MKLPCKCIAALEIEKLGIDRRIAVTRAFFGQILQGCNAVYPEYLISLHESERIRHMRRGICRSHSRAEQ